MVWKILEIVIDRWIVRLRQTLCSFRKLFLLRFINDFTFLYCWLQGWLELVHLWLNPLLTIFWWGIGIWINFVVVVELITRWLDILIIIVFVLILVFVVIEILKIVYLILWILFVAKSLLLLQRPAIYILIGSRVAFIYANVVVLLNQLLLNLLLGHLLPIIFLKHGHLVLLNLMLRLLWVGYHFRLDFSLLEFWLL